MRQMFDKRIFSLHFMGVTTISFCRSKRKYDANGIFYAPTGVGSEYWEEEADGRLCRIEQDI
jgi:hypothetical protein